MWASGWVCLYAHVRRRNAPHPIKYIHWLDNLDITFRIGGLCESERAPFAHQAVTFDELRFFFSASVFIFSDVCLRVSDSISIQFKQNFKWFFVIAVAVVVIIVMRSRWCSWYREIWTLRWHNLTNQKLYEHTKTEKAHFSLSFGFAQRTMFFVCERKKNFFSSFKLNRFICIVWKYFSLSIFDLAVSPSFVNRIWNGLNGINIYHDLKYESFDSNWIGQSEWEKKLGRS